MAPSSFKKKPGRRPRLSRLSDVILDGTPAKRQRVEHDEIEGVDIFSFENELELEYFTNIEEPLPRKIHAFRGFDENDYDSANLRLIKSSFDQFIKGNDANSLRKGCSEKVSDPQCTTTSSATVHVADDLIILSDDESASEPTAVPHVDTAEPVTTKDDPVQLASETPAEVITIDDDSDDDVVMISDPSAPLPKPVRDCVCPNCGKVRRTDQNRQVAGTVKDLGAANLPKLTDEVTIITDGDVPAESAPVQNTIHPKDGLHNETPAQPVEISEVPAQPAEVPTEKVSVPAAAAEPRSIPSSQSPAVVNSPSTGDPSSSPSRSHDSPKPSIDFPPEVQNPSDLLRPPATVPQTLRVVSKESGKTFFLKINRNKSKILKPASLSNLYSLDQHPKSLHHLPGEKQCEVSSRMDTSKCDQKPPLTPAQAVGVGAGRPKLLTKAVVIPRTIEVDIRQPSLTSKSFVGVQTVGTIQPNSSSKSEVSLHPVEHKNLQPNGVTPRVIAIPPRFSVQNEVIRAQPISTAKGQAHAEDSIVAKSGGIVLRSSPRAGVVLPPQPQQQQQFKTVAGVQKTAAVAAASDLGELKPARLNGIKDSAVFDSTTYDKTEVECTDTGASSEPVVLEDDTKSVVKDLIDFVCRTEEFPTSYPYDWERTEQISLDIPCRQLRCRMGCLCVSLAKKNVRRVRCKNADCIFGCVCVSPGVVISGNRHAKTLPNLKAPGTSRRKQVLTIIPDFDMDSYRNGLQPAVKSFLPIQKVAGVGRSVSCGPIPSIVPQGSGSSYKSSTRKVPGVPRTGHVSGYSVSEESTPKSLVRGTHLAHQDSGFTSSTLPSKRLLQVASKARVRKTTVTHGQKLHPNSDSAPADKPPTPDVPKSIAVCQEPAKWAPGPVAQTRRFFGREKTPIPERALMCLTPGLGYVPLGEIHPTVTFDSPFKPGSSKTFLSVRQATEWLNSKLETLLNTPPDLRWVVADRQTIEKKQQHRLSVDLLSSPNCTISRKGAVFSS